MNKNNCYCVILAGGPGTRFWPMSRVAKPKQFLDVADSGKTFIRQTYERFLRVVPQDNIIVVSSVRYRDLVMEQIPELPEENLLLEPYSRNTAPCIAYATYTLLRRDPEARMVVAPSDHFIQDEDLFARTISYAFDYISENDTLMTLGILPTRPDTNYGYIQATGGKEAFRSEVPMPVKTFTEKPDKELAQVFINTGEFFWNSGIFIWSVKAIVKAFEIYLPEHHALFSSKLDDYGTERETAAIEEVFSECKAISIDYGVMEKAENVYVRCGEFGWSDVGTWGSVYQLSEKDKNENAVVAEACYTYSTERTFISLPKGKIAVVNGLSDYIVVDTPDALLICPRSEEQSIKNFIDDVHFANGEKFI